MIEYWEGDAYPDFVAEGTGDQHAINGAICAVKKATYDGTDCVGGDDTATGTVRRHRVVSGVVNVLRSCRHILVGACGQVLDSLRCTVRCVEQALN